MEHWIVAWSFDDHCELGEGHGGAFRMELARGTGGGVPDGELNRNKGEEAAGSKRLGHEETVRVIEVVGKRETILEAEALIQPVGRLKGLHRASL